LSFFKEFKKELASKNKKREPIKNIALKFFDNKLTVIIEKIEQL